VRASRKDWIDPVDRAGDQQQLSAVLAGYGLSYALVATVETGGRFAVRTEEGFHGLGAGVLEVLVPVLLERSDLLVVSDARDDPRFAAMATGEPALVAFMASLLRTSDGTPVGMIVVADTEIRPFGTAAVGRMRLGVGVLEGQFADRQEAARAHAVQQALLPVDETIPDGYEFDGCSILHGQITGAYFDWHRIGDDLVGFGLTESSGSGVGAGMIAAAARSALRTAATFGGRSDPAESVERTESALADDLSVANARVSLLYGTLTPATGEVRFVNAGLEPPLILRAETAPPLPVAEYSAATRSTPVGSDEETLRTIESVTLNPGDTLVVASASAWAVLAVTRSPDQSAAAMVDAVDGWASSHPEYLGVAIVAITRTRSRRPDRPVE
jgi:Stage II sporulation protein E (SpoIIE)